MSKEKWWGHSGGPGRWPSWGLWRPRSSRMLRKKWWKGSGGPGRGVSGCQGGNDEQTKEDDQPSTSSRHQKACTDSPKLKCDQCDYKTHERSHLLAHAKVHMEKFHCSTCGKQFAGKERLAALEDCQKKGLKCSKCPEVFKTVGAKYWHYQKKHMNKTVRNKVGFFSIDSSFFQQTEAVKKSPKVHQCRSVKGSNFARHSCQIKSQRRKRKLASIKSVLKVVIITPETPTISTVISSRVEDLSSPSSSFVILLFLLSSGTCPSTSQRLLPSWEVKSIIPRIRRFKATRPKTRPLITRNHDFNVANRVAISSKKMKTVLHAIRDVIGEDMFDKYCISWKY